MERQQLDTPCWVSSSFSDHSITWPSLHHFPPAYLLSSWNALLANIPLFTLSFHSKRCSHTCNDTSIPKRNDRVPVSDILPLVLFC